MKKVTAQILLLALPTIVMIAYLLWRLNNSYSILENDWLRQDIYFASGSILGIIFYSRRFRFASTTAILFILFSTVYKFLGSITMGEFDAFYFSVQFLIFIILFSIGWLAGFGFSRARYFTISWSILLLAIQIIAVSRTSDIKVNALINAFVPFLAYAFYIIYSSELIRNMNEDETHFGRFVAKRLAGFIILILVLLIALFTFFKSDFKAIEKEWGSSQTKDNKGNDGGNNNESMTQKDKNGGVSNKDQTKLSGSLNKDKQLIFVARLDNFFDDGKTPNPLYFTNCYYTKFDTATQTFEKDPNMPYNDLFEPDPSQIPLYFAKTDKSLINNSLSSLNRKVVTAEIYNVNLASNVFLAPSTAFYCQPISVPKEFKQQFKSAYTAKMWVSELNSAYFIYNPADNYMLAQFQELRFEKLRQIDEIKGPDQKFMDYYTYMPRDEEYHKITELTKNITKEAFTPIDKILAIRDYFLSKDEFDQPLFKYSDNPGIPGMPSANKLTYFLMENRKGYCAYFAGATLFMLRSLGIPSRVAAGFSAVDRSNVNPGWYWFYQDQAHAWVQVYFQGYGWIDFDTTIPDVNTQQSPQPDGTPPINLPQTYLVADGEIKTIDPAKKQVTMSVRKMLFHDKDYDASRAEEILTDVSMATFTSDTGEIKLSNLKPGNHITAVSRTEILKNIKPETNDSLYSILLKLPKPVPIDEIKLILKEDQKKKNEEKEKKEEPTDWMNILKDVLISLTGIILLVFLSPWLIWQYLNAKAKRSGNKKAFNSYNAALYYLNQLGYGVDGKGPREYAFYIDKEFGTDLNTFSNSYQKLKYSSVQLNESENKSIENFYRPFMKQIKEKVSFKIRLGRFLNVTRTMNYFRKIKTR